ncbi:uncharacterized protein LY89DRAFT_727475 [Mollisia scopiformis]|uniref:Uncharacterized protein n=1 Tax=Mollisia scopiformis TaxID=149040 RepID=A0A194XWP7_MOLSC|nr:uncharacterized protein LY89DRAFT_727475 [Mollisia scopiformis]KUJ24449.1 hypothetical protein LY89DRAFT_727475 [Mollisia scopiformis]
MSTSSFRVRYRMLPSKDDPNAVEVCDAPCDEPQLKRSWLREFLSRETYYGSLLFNIGAFALPALYATLSKLWVANIDSSQVVTTDVYTYIGVIVEVLNDGLPRASWTVMGDKSTRTQQSRISLSYTLIIFQTFFGFILTIIFIASAERLAGAFVPAAVRQTSLTYVRISSVQALSSAVETAVSNCTRSLDHPDVPLLISCLKFFINIFLDLLIISRFHVGTRAPTVNTQALIRMACDLSSATAGLAYFIYIVVKLQRRSLEPSSKSRPSLASLQTLAIPGKWTFMESALRNAIYLWLISGIVSTGSDYATAWGVFNTIRWGIFMVPVQALQASALAFIGHAWGEWRAQVGATLRRPKATKKDLLLITHKAWVSCAIALAVEVPVCLFLSFWGIESFAYYLSESESVASTTQHMWKTIDWCYIFYALNAQIGAILLATTTRWYLIQALGSNLLWMLPWAIVVTRINMTPDSAWHYDSIIFGGALVFDFFNVGLVVAIWAWLLMRGRVSLSPVSGNL